uniref:L-aminoadipate-semialdehyde dehydrogenase-phosphopantetheinyl transferase n=1 Tax=Aceria tosichella TaxID=561515 RepID=A0A6G1S462_9ACAR
MVNHVRWCFNVARWEPTREEWLKLTSSIAREELERINKFVFQDSPKSSLIGCALIRKFLTLATSTPSNDIVLTRSPRGRPEVCETYRRSQKETWPPMFDFNVSHSGDYCVLAGVWSKRESPIIRVGVDVTKIIKKESTSELNRFLDLMSKRPFTIDEWDTVKKATSDRQKCINFTRLWCLKESYIKAIGLGLAFNLRRIDFKFSEEHNWNISTSTLRHNMLSDTTVMLDGHPETNWRFYETALDDEHMVSLAYNILNARKVDEVPHCHDQFENLSINSILESLTPLTAADDNDWAHFSSRSVRSSR